MVREIAQGMECIANISELPPEHMDLFFPEWHENIHGFSYILRLQNLTSGNVKLGFWPNISLTHFDARNTQFVFPHPEDEKNAWNTFGEPHINNGRMKRSDGRLEKWESFSMSSQVFLTSTEALTLEEIAKKPQIFVEYSRDYAPERVVFCTVSEIFQLPEIPQNQ